MRVTGLVSDARQGEVVFAQEGIIIRGKAIPVSEVVIPVEVASFLFCQMAGLITAHVILQYACLRPIEWYVPWSDVKQIVFHPKKPWAGIVYNYPDRRGRTRTFTLAAAFLPAQFEQFRMMAQSVLGPAADFGKLKPGTSPVLFYFVLAIILLLVGAGIFSSINQGSGTVR